MACQYPTSEFNLMVKNKELGANPVSRFGQSRAAAFQLESVAPPGPAGWGGWGGGGVRVPGSMGGASPCAVFLSLK